MGYFKFDRDLLARIAQDADLTGADCRMLLTIAASTRLPGDTIGVGADFLARETGVTTRCIKKNRAKLIKKGYLQRVGTGHGGVMLVRLNVPEPQPTGESPFTTQGHACSPLPVTPVHPSGEPAFTPAPQGTLYKETKETETEETAPEADRVLFLNNEFVVPQSIRDAWTKAYPDADIDLCLREATAWFLADGQRRSDYGVFLNNWIKRQKNSAPASNHKQQPKKESPYLPDGQWNPFYDYYATPEQMAEMEKWAMDDDDEVR